MKPRDEIEARAWAITGRMLNPPMIDQLVELIQECANEQARDVQASRLDTEHIHAVTEFRRRHLREQQARFDADMQYTIHLLAQMMEEADPLPAVVCEVCYAAVPPTCRHCTRCGCAVPVPAAAAAEGLDDDTVPVAGAA